MMEGTPFEHLVQESANRIRRLVKALRDRRRRGRRRLEEIFSREVLGAVLVSVAAGKIVEQIIVIVAPSRPLRLVAWTLAFGVFVWVFVYWERLAGAAADAADAAEDAVDSES